MEGEPAPFLLHRPILLALFVPRSGLSRTLHLWVCIHSFSVYHFLGWFSRRQIDIFLTYFSVETFCMKCQNLFSGKNKKNISICHLLTILPVVPSINMIIVYSTGVCTTSQSVGKSWRSRRRIRCYHASHYVSGKFLSYLPVINLLHTFR